MDAPGHDRCLAVVEATRPPPPKATSQGTLDERRRDGFSTEVECRLEQNQSASGAPPLRRRRGKTPDRQLPEQREQVHSAGVRELRCQESESGLVFVP